MPRRSEFTDHPHGRLTGALFPDVFATHDWGVVGDHKFDVKQLNEMKSECTKHCLSTCNYILGYCYDTARVLHWIMKTAKGGFRGVESF